MGAEQSVETAPAAAAAADPPLPAPVTASASAPSAPAAPAVIAPFISSGTFAGAKAGYVFRMGSSGLGYYIEGHLDSAAAPAATDARTAVRAVSAATNAKKAIRAAPAATNTKTDTRAKMADKSRATRCPYGAEVEAYGREADRQGRQIAQEKAKAKSKAKSTWEQDLRQLVMREVGRREDERRTLGWVSAGGSTACSASDHMDKIQAERAAELKKLVAKSSCVSPELEMDLLHLEKREADRQKRRGSTIGSMYSGKDVSARQELENMQAEREADQKKLVASHCVTPDDFAGLWS